MTAKPQPHQASVLIVDELAESLEVLRTVLERRGVSVFQASGADQGLELLQNHHPDVVVLDLDLAAGDGESMQSAYEAQTRLSDAALVVLGKTRRPCRLPLECVIAKPYHYGPLIRTIEALLER